MTVEHRPRTLGFACAGLLASAAALWGSSEAVWYRVTAAGPTDRLVDLTGAQVRPSLGGVALVALAGVAGVVATAGPVRRVVGAVLAAAGLAVGGAGLLGFAASPFASDGPAASLPGPPPGVTLDALRHQPTDTTPAPLLAVLGGLVLVAVGVLVVVREARLPRFGARYATGRPGGGDTRPAPTDPDRAAWQELDAGIDPTDPRTSPEATGSHQARGPADGPDDGPGRGAD